MDPTVRAAQEEVERLAPLVQAVQAEVGKAVVGQRGMVDALLLGLLTGGHVLLEGVPGLAKTLSVRSLARVLALDFARIQFTPDLLPADLVGTLIYDQRSGEFTPKKGPVFANIVLADEINRAPAKVQSALLESMQERQVTLGDTTFPLPDPFLVLATQNPLEQEGTYPLPEAQVDRFMLKALVGYPDRDEERTILDRMVDGGLPELAPVLDAGQLATLRDAVAKVYIDAKVREYAIDLVRASRDPGQHDLAIARLVQWGGSPRATISLAQAGRAHALLAGRGFVTPEDIKSVAPLVLRHRVAVNYEAEAEGLSSEDIVQALLEHVPVP